ncbi:MAG: RsmB/NOP family class I SAM-dependent RNA methyltransferase [Cypionkella sp.]|nr:RsmB/NOP family class I SAM-dependent RNA methyltransferase [Cypionkella sp.]
MTPGARIAAAIGVLDRILAGEPAEKALVNWARASRFAGSGDRAAVRDLVFDAVRRKRSYAALGGAETGRGLMLGRLRAAAEDVAALFTGEGHAPAPPGPEEAGRAPDGAEALDLPDWILPRLGERAEAVGRALRDRAPVFLRVNLARTTQAKALAVLAEDGIVARPHPLAASALEVTEGQRRIDGARAYRMGLVELQDAASQAVVEALPLRDGMRVLDHCAGGGGKTLAMAARARLHLFAHDAAAQRLRDLPERAKRAGVRVTLTDMPEAGAPYDLVLIDVPCSGSGSWRRDPAGKWRLTPESLLQLGQVQRAILARAAAMVAPGGVLAYATCSVLAEENESRIVDFLSENQHWEAQQMLRLDLAQGGDGFFLAVLARKDARK